MAEVFFIFCETLRNEESLSLLTDTPAIRIFMYFLLQKKKVVF